MFPSNDIPQKLYLDLLKGCLTRLLFPDSCVNTQLAPTGQFDPVARRNGQDWPYEAETMIGMKRLDNVEHCVRDVLRRNVPGDLVETGVWRGGASILMRAVLKAYGDTSRSVWVADSFEGLPRANSDLYPADSEDRLADFNDYLGVPLERVQANFERYNLLDAQVRFLKGWFRDTLPSAPIDRIAVLRLDGDMYESTMDTLNNLYDKVQVGGYIIVDDYGCLANCRSAVEDFRHRRGIVDPIQPIDWSGVFWQRTSLEISGLEIGEATATSNSTLPAAESGIAVSQNEALARDLSEAQDLVQRYQSDLRTSDRALSEMQKLAFERETEAVALTRGLAEAQELAQKYQSELRTYDRALGEAQKLASEREARIFHLTEVHSQLRRELAGREEQLCSLSAALSEVRRQAAELEHDSSQAREELQRKSAYLLEVESRYSNCGQRLLEVETSLCWRLTRPLRGLPALRRSRKS